MTRTLRLAVAQTAVPDDPGDADGVRAAGREIRTLMREASAGGARLVQFPEGALVYPSKEVMSPDSQGSVESAGWDRADWDLLRTEAQAIAALAGELGLWVAFGSIHPLTPPHRPHNSLYIVSDTGDLVARYDKRYLSHTEVSYLYTPGREPVVFDVDGFRLGVALCIEARFPELFADYERLDVDGVLLSVGGDEPMLAVVAQSYAALNCYWVGLSVPAQYGAAAGIVAPGGRWLARCPPEDRPGLAYADLRRDPTDPDIDIAVRLARPWRRRARRGIYQARMVEGDPRSDSTSEF